MSLLRVADGSGAIVEEILRYNRKIDGIIQVELDVLPDNIFLVSDEEGHHKLHITSPRCPQVVD